MGHVPTVTAISTVHLMGAAARAGVDVRGITARLRLPPSPSYEDRIPMARLVAAWEAVVRAADDPAFPLRAAEYAPRDTRSLLTFLCATQPTIGHAVDTLVRYWPTVTDAYHVHVETQRAQFAIVFDPAGAADRAGWWWYQEFELADLVTTAARLTGGAARPTRITFRHRASARPADYLRTFGLAPRFADERTSAVFPRTVLDLAIDGPPLALGPLVKDRLDALRDRAEAASTAAQRVRAALPKLLRDGRATATEAARRLGLGRRTLERRLVDERTSFRALLDEARSALARAWLRDVPIPEVADRLGYADVRAFDRAFRRWTGTTPSTWRTR